MDMYQESSLGNLPKFFQAASAIEIYKFKEVDLPNPPSPLPLANLKLEKEYFAGKRQDDGIRGQTY